jgi:hypothetical protein
VGTVTEPGEMIGPPEDIWEAIEGGFGLSGVIGDNGGLGWKAAVMSRHQRELDAGIDSERGTLTISHVDIRIITGLATLDQPMTSQRIFP